MFLFQSPSIFPLKPYTDAQVSLVPHKNKKRLRHESQPFDAERTRFELAVGLLLRQFSKLLVSATHPPLQCFVLICF